MWAITDRIYLGNSEAGRDQQIFVGDPRQPNPMKTHLTLNVANDLPLYSDAIVGLVDGPGNDDWTIRTAVETLRSMLKWSDKPILVHCHEGRSRSVLVIASHLWGRKAHTIEEAVDYIRTKREDIRPHPDLVADFKRVFE